MIYSDAKHSHNKSVVLLSGGIDSSTVAAIAKAEGYELYALSFNYGQRHRRELDSARMVAESLGIKRHLIIKFDLREIGGSALTAEMEVPKNRTELLNERAEVTLRKDSLSESPNLQASRLPDFGGIPITYVPARNTIFLSFALAWAEVLEASDIFIGANAVDYSGYPDCRSEYLRAFEDMANLATKVSVEGRLRFRIRAPLLYMTKAEIIRKGVELGLDYSLTWSCYDPQEISAEERKSERAEVTLRKNFLLELPHLRSNSVPCGRCDSCLFRAKGFQEAGLRDPLA